MLRRRHSLQYLIYLRSPLWRLRRRLWILQARGRCQRCRSRRALSIHHRTYTRLGHERHADIKVLCWPCHQLEQRQTPFPARPRWPWTTPGAARLTAHHPRQRHPGRHGPLVLTVALAAYLAITLADTVPHR
jgi:hypothetical protein